MVPVGGGGVFLAGFFIFFFVFFVAFLLAFFLAAFFLVAMCDSRLVLLVKRTEAHQDSLKRVK
jgi:hypothetical protein